jgi:outer membrane protein assembly factor BamB
MPEIHVECYAGYRADERPLRFELRGRWFEVAEVKDRWYSPGSIYFRVRADDGNLYIVRHEEGTDTWTLDTPEPYDANS